MCYCAAMLLFSCVMLSRHWDNMYFQAFMIGFRKYRHFLYFLLTFL